MDREETLARALCRAEGLDPDEAVARPVPPAEGPGGSDPPRACWTQFSAQAARIIATFEGLREGV